MMASEGIIGFALAFFGASALGSAVLGAAHLAAARRLQALGPSVERRVAALVLALPPALALLVTAVLAVDSALAVRAGTDHCLEHSHHLHLCIVHGAPWGAHPWAIAAVAAATTWVATKVARLSWLHVRAELHARQLARVAGEAHEGTQSTPGYRIVASEVPFAFTAGIAAPRIFVSEGAWQTLTEQQRRAVITHERGHVRRADLRWRALLGAWACFGIPQVASRALRAWELAAEELCDRDAAAAVSRPSLVASAILAMARAQADDRVLAAASFAAGSRTDARVRALLSDREDRSSRVGPLTMLALGAALAIVVVTATQATPLHHVIETIFG